jgi:hypothetical protein
MRHALKVHSVAETVVFFSVWTLFCVGFFAIGFYMIRDPERTAALFRGMGGALFGHKRANKTYTAKNMLWAAWPFVILTPPGVALGVYQIVRAVITGTGS